MKMTFVHVYNTLHIHTVHPGLYSTIFLAEGPSFVDTTPPSASYTQQQWKVHANSEIICGEIRNALHNPFPPFWERHAGSSALCWRAVKPNATHEILYNPGKGCTVGRVFMRSLWIMRRVSFRYCPDCIVRGTLAKIYLDALRFADEVQVRRFGESAIVPASEWLELPRHRATPVITSLTSLSAVHCNRPDDARAHTLQ